MWKQRLRISWRTSQGAGNMRNKRLSGWPLAVYILYAAALSMLSLYAAYLMGEQFGLPLEKRWPASLWVAAGWSLVIIAWDEAMYAWRKRVLRLVGSAALFLVAYWGPNWWLLLDEINQQKWHNGMGGLTLRYMEIWNQYFVTSRRLPQAVEATLAEQQWAWGVLWAMLALLLQVFSGFLRKRVVMLLLPVVALAMGMLVGVTPKWPGMACMFAAGVLSLYLDCHREFRPVLALALAGLLALLLPLTAWVMGGTAARINQSHDRLQAFQHRMERSVREYDWQALFSTRRDGQVNNRKPEYEKKEVLTITVSEQPETNLYLRGYCGANYRRGRWEDGKSAFDSACRRQGLDSGEAARLLAGLGVSNRFGAGVRYTLRYTGPDSISAYLPYEADLKTLREGLWLSGDYVVEKSKSLGGLVFEGCTPGALVADDSRQWNSDVQKFYLWYNEYVAEQYLVVPAGLRELTSIVNDIRASDSCRHILERPQGDAAGRNAVRLALGSLVAEELGSLARYDIDPGALPWGTDPVEYFLGENHQGYCVHFASAGALMLRQLGVPARFVTGYVVQPWQFRRSDSGYQASVRDDAAHAWVEIWLENVGWVPVEMTPGYEAQEGALAQLGRSESGLVPTPTLEREQAPLPGGEQEPSEPPQSTAAPTKQPQESETQPGLTRPGALAAGPGIGDLQEPDGEETEGWGFAGEGGWAVFGQNGSLRVSRLVLVFLEILAAAGIVWLAVLWAARLRANRRQRLWRDIESGGARRAVRIINRKLYGRLWRRRAGFLTLRSDEEYLAALKRQYPREDWESYLAVVRRAVYSREEIDVREAMGCYELLRRTKPRRHGERT